MLSADALRRLLVTACVLGAAAGLVGCGGDEASVAATESALADLRPQVEQIDGVLSITELGIGRSTSVPMPTLIGVDLRVAGDAEAAREVVDQVAALVWRSDIPEISVLNVTAVPEDPGPPARLSDLLGGSPEPERLEARYGPRDG